MAKLFEELDYQITPLGVLSLRRRRQLKLDKDVVEVILNDEHLMSDMFTASEIALADLPLSGMTQTAPDILVGGLGLGYTAQAVLAYAHVRSVTIIEYLAPVISWHQHGLLPMGTALVDDPRCQIVEADFFACAAGNDGFDKAQPYRTFDGIFLDIDHAPDFHLNQSHAGFYTEGGLRKLASHLNEGGVFALWSNDQADDAFVNRLGDVFTYAHAEDVVFYNPLLETDCTQTVYIAQK
ncbi:spermidine synthase [Alphaproteobacteria bacterium]|nr:spermidine synthase [Alphaproteobacteria bacterium]